LCVTPRTQLTSAGHQMEHILQCGTAVSLTGKLSLEGCLGMPVDTLGKTIDSIKMYAAQNACANTVDIAVCVKIVCFRSLQSTSLYLFQQPLFIFC